jgi:hypothetical protein
LAHLAVAPTDLSASVSTQGEIGAPVVEAVHELEASVEPHSVPIRVHEGAALSPPAIEPAGLRVAPPLCFDEAQCVRRPPPAS